MAQADPASTSVEPCTRPCGGDPDVFAAGRVAVASLALLPHREGRLLDLREVCPQDVAAMMKEDLSRAMIDAEHRIPCQAPFLEFSCSETGLCHRMTKGLSSDTAGNEKYSGKTGRKELERIVEENKGANVWINLSDVMFRRDAQKEKDGREMKKVE